jgi:alpha-L-fucosidase
VEYAQLLNDASEVKFRDQPEHFGGSTEGTLTLELPVRKPDVVVPVIEVFLKE